MTSENPIHPIPKGKDILVKEKGDVIMKILFLLLILLVFVSGCVSVEYDNIDGIEIDKECMTSLYHLYMQGSNVTEDDISNCKIYLIKKNETNN